MTGKALFLATARQYSFVDETQKLRLLPDLMGLVAITRERKRGGLVNNPQQEKCRKQKIIPGREGHAILNIELSVITLPIDGKRESSLL